MERRTVLKGAAIAPWIAARSSAANSAVTVGLIGSGSRGTYITGLLAKNTPARVVQPGLDLGGRVAHDRGGDAADLVFECRRRFPVWEPGIQILDCSASAKSGWVLGTIRQPVVGHPSRGLPTVAPAIVGNVRLVGWVFGTISATGSSVRHDEDQTF